MPTKKTAKKKPLKPAAKPAKSPKAVKPTKPVRGKAEARKPEARRAKAVKPVKPAASKPTPKAAPASKAVVNPKAAPPAKASAKALPPAKTTPPIPTRPEPKLKTTPRAKVLKKAEPVVESRPLPLKKHKSEPPKPISLEARFAELEARLLKTEPQFQAQYRESLDMSWIYHDSAIEGVVYTFQELQTAIDPGANVALDSSLQPVCEEIRRHREALEFIRDFATKKRLPVTLDVVKKIYLILHPEEGDVKSVRYRKDIPQHRLYFHEYAAPDKITYKMRQVVDWVNDPETRRTRNTVRIAGRAHYDLLRIFPFTNDSGKVARLFMNLLLMRAGLPPAIIHSTERQRYYEALKGASATMMQIVQEAIDNNLASIEKLLDTNDAKIAEAEAAQRESARVATEDA